jgi:serine protease
MLDAGILVPGWKRTGYNFKVRPVGDPRGLYACRFFGTPGVGPNSHFFTINHAECDKVRADRFWTYEGVAFNADAPANAECAPDRVPVVRMYNNGKGGQANHRFSTSHSEIGDMLGEGWIVEGPVFCGLP